MTFILLVEGVTEKKVVGPFLKRWLDRRLGMPVSIKPVKFGGSADLVKDSAKRAQMYLEAPGKSEVIAVISLLDLAGSKFYRDDLPSAGECACVGKQELESKVNHERFRHFFAVHELEAWLLAQPEIFPADVRPLLPTAAPETIDADRPPAKLLGDVYRRVKKNQGYKKTVDGVNLFSKLDPEVAYKKCPHLKMMLDEILRLARAASV